MIVTQDYIKNSEFEEDKLSEKRCQEINQMMIKNPFYPSVYYESKEYFTVEENYFLHSKDENIIYINAFWPLGVYVKELGINDYVNILIVGDKWFPIDFKCISSLREYDEEISVVTGTFRLKDCSELDNREDMAEIIYLFEKVYVNSIYPDKHIIRKCNIEYKGKMYLWDNFFNQ